MRAEAHFDGKVGGMISAALRPVQSKPRTFSIARRYAISGASGQYKAQTLDVPQSPLRENP